MQIVASPREIVVAGAGIVGCAIADELSRRGASVVVVDDRAPGLGATQAAAGVLAPFIEARHEGPLLALTARSLGLFDELIARLRAESASALTYQPTGTLGVAMDAEAFSVPARARERLVTQRVVAELLRGDAVCRCEP